jgi:hypothetical protein
MTRWQAALHSTVCLRIEVDRSNLFTISFHKLVLSCVQLHIFNENTIFLRELSQDTPSTANTEQFDNLQVCTTVILHIVFLYGAGRLRWVKCSMIERMRFDRRQRRGFTFFQKVQTDAEAHRVPYLMDTTGLFSGDVKLTTHVHLMLR